VHNTIHGSLNHIYIDKNKVILYPYSRRKIHMPGTASTKVPIKGDVLKWARESIGIAQEKAAKRAKVALDIYKKWEKGEDAPSISRLRNLANLFKRPLPVLLLKNVPESPPLPTDFRKPSNIIEQPLSEASLLALRKARWYQSVARELLKDLGQPIHKIKSPQLKNQPVDAIIEKNRKLDIEIQMSWKDNWQALKEWRKHLESLGILVFQFSMPVEEVRGFSITREGYPSVIAISSKDSPNGRIFTLFHEYCHVLLEESGLCNPSEFNDKDHSSIEKRCNEFSGHFLVPTNQLTKSISLAGDLEKMDLISKMSNTFRVSRFVILRRLYDLNEIDYNEYQRLFSILQDNIKKSAPSSGGGNYYRNKFAEKGKEFIRLVIEAESSRKITLSRALDYLDIKAQQFDKIREMIY
jgi:Zn-dependent peptidase ImmA (M78 family)/DNA-binding XRE family transcriptional regulator